MEGPDIFSVALFGFPPTERKALTSIFKLAATSRPRCYEVCPRDRKHRAQLYIVDFDDEVAREEWHTLATLDSSKPSVRASTRPRNGDGWIRRPLILVHLLNALDRFTVSAYHSVPELIIDDDQLLDGPAHDVVTGIAAERARHNHSPHLALVVDDSSAVRKAMEVELNLLGVRADFTATGEEALEQASYRHYDIVFLDVMLPGIDGYKVCKAFKRLNRASKIVFLTGRGGSIDKLRGTLAGGSGYLTKPVSHDSLRAVVRKHLPAGDDLFLRGLGSDKPTYQL